MKAKIITIEHDELVKILGLPEDSVIAHLNRDFNSQAFKIVVHSKEFFEVKPGYQLINHRGLSEVNN